MVAHAIVNLSTRRHQPFIRINCAAMPENIRELVNAIKVAVSFSSEVINCEHLPVHILKQIEESKTLDINHNLRLSTDEIEREAILTALEEYKGNKIKVAKHLGISRSNLYYKIKKLNIRIKTNLKN